MAKKKKSVVTKDQIKEAFDELEYAVQERPMVESTSGAEAAPPTGHPASDEPSTTPQELHSSPYTEPPFELIIGPRNTVNYVPRHLVPPEWRETGPERRFYLPSVDESTGHTIVHYLYTKSFETLANMGNSANIGFTQALLVYIATAECSSLEGLQAAAVYEMESRGSSLGIFEVLSATESHFSKLMKKSWVHDYLPKRAREAFEENHGIFKTEAFLESIGGAELFRFMMTCAVHVYYDKISRMIDADTELKQRLVLQDGLVQGEPVEEDVLEQSVKEQEHSTSTQHDTLSSDDFCTISCPSSECSVDATLEETGSVERMQGKKLEMKLRRKMAASAVMLDPESVPVVDPFAGLCKSQKKKLQERMKKEAADKAFEEDRLRIEPDAVEQCLALDLAAPELIPDAAMPDSGHMLSDDPLTRQIQMIQEIVADAFERERQRVAEENA